MTPLDVLIRSRRDARDSEIEKSLVNIAGTTSLAKQDDSSNSNSNNSSGSSNNNNNKNNDCSWQSFMKQHVEWLEKKKESLMVVASLIATMAFQVGVNPPGGVWQDDRPGSVDAQGMPVDDSHIAGESVFGYKYPDDYLLFYITNALAFLSSLSIVLLLTSGLPMRRRFFMWVLMVVTWVAITAIALCYVMVLIVVTPTGHYDMLTKVITKTVFAWIALMALLLIAHTVRMTIKFVKIIKKAWVRMRVRRYARLTPQNHKV